MVRIATLTHDPRFPVVRTPQAEHPFSRARQFQRAFNATKLNKMFAKPFLGALKGHSDGVSVLARCPLALNKFISGAHDGEVRVWDLTERRTLVSVYQHAHSVKGVCFNPQGSFFLSSSLDKTINLYNFRAMLEDDSDNYEFGRQKKQPKMEPVTKYLSKAIIGNVDHCPQGNTFATSGQLLQVWSYQRTKPIFKLQWNVDSILCVKYDPSQPNILCGTCIDRSVILYDLRSQSAVQKVSLPNKSMCVSFNPLQPINLTIGSDDSNCYTFDVRRMQRATTIHKDHIGAVTDISYSPTGRQFATGSYDRTVRIFNYNGGRSREVYHGRRMQLVSSVQYTMDGQQVLSGSEDMNIRLWKSIAWRPIGNMNEREERAVLYREKLIEKYKHSNRIRRIAHYRHIPKYILNAHKREQDKSVSKHNKMINTEANTGQRIIKKKEKVQVIQYVGVNTFKNQQVEEQ